jgi:hypothetical protein
MLMSCKTKLFIFNLFCVTVNILCACRDELCRGGDLLHSPALSYTLLHLAAAVEATRQQKLLQEQPEEEAETRSSEDSLRVSSALGCESYASMVTVWTPGICD